MEPSTRTLAPITSTNEAKASMSTASSTASRTSDSPSKSPLWRLPPDVLTNLQPSYWTRRSSHGPPDGGPAGAVPPAGFVLVRIGLVNAVMGRRWRRAVREVSAIQSNRAALSRAAITVSQGEFELGYVEGALAGLNGIRNPASGDRVAEPC